MLRFITALAIVCGTLVLHGQAPLPGHFERPYKNYDRDYPDAAYYRQHRDQLRAILPDNAVAAFFSAPVHERSLDIEYPYHQSPDLFYFTGYRDQDAMLLVFSSPITLNGKAVREILFVRDRDPRAEQWTGLRIGVQDAQRTLDVDTVLSNHSFAQLDLDFNRFASVLYVLPEQPVSDDPGDGDDLGSLIRHFKIKTDSIRSFEDPRSLNEYCARLRQSKDAAELNFTRKAVSLTCNGLSTAIKTMIPGQYEYQVAAKIEYEFAMGGAESPAFPSICGSGENACVLHYSTNRRKLKSGDMIVMDVGAEYHGYAADITRTVPVSGTFSPEQRLLYELVLKARAAGIAACKKGTRFWEPGQIAQRIIQKGLMELGIISSWDQAPAYYVHGFSHYVGLDVHDVGLYANLAPGQVLTMEPGIYIPAGSPCDPRWWKIGIRIEDDILITATGNEVLSACIPYSIEAIEAMMQTGR